MPDAEYVVLLLLCLVAFQCLIARTDGLRFSTTIQCPNTYMRPIVIPLECDHNNIFLLSLRLNDGIVAKFAADTGSHSILIAEENCVQSCQSSEGKDLSTIHYGSQSSPYHEQTMPLTLENAYETDCNGNYEHRHNPWLLHSRSTCIRSKPARVKIAVDFHGTSEYNVVGLGKRSEFLSKFVPTFPRSVVMHINSRYRATLMLYQPGVDCIAKNHFMLDNNNRVQGKVNDKKYSILFDTGSNCLVLPSVLYHEERDSLRIHLAGTTREHIMDIDYNKNNYGNRQVIESTRNNVIIVGVTFLVGYSVGIIQTRDFSYLTLNSL